MIAERIEPQKATESVQLISPLGNSESFFTIFVEDEIFGLPVSQTQTIFRVEKITAIPGGPKDIAGLVNLRGKVVTAVSLRRRLGLPPALSSSGSFALGVDYGSDSFALIVDRIGDVLTLKESSKIAMPPHLDAQRLHYTSALYRTEAVLLPILDPGKLFDMSCQSLSISR